MLRGGQHSSSLGTMERVRPWTYLLYRCHAVHRKSSAYALLFHVTDGGRQVRTKPSSALADDKRHAGVRGWAESRPWAKRPLAVKSANSRRCQRKVGSSIDGTVGHQAIVSQWIKSRKDTLMPDTA